MNNCFIENPKINNRLDDIINELSGGNVTLSSKYHIEVKKKEFNDFLSKQLGYEGSLESTSKVVLTKAIKDWYNKNNFSIDNTSNITEQSNIKGFTSINAKQLMLDHTANLLSNFWYQIDSRQLSNSDGKPLNTNEKLIKVINGVKARLTNQFKERIINLSNTNKDFNNIVKESNFNDSSIIKIYNAIEKYGSSADKNFMALYKQILSNPVEWFTETMYNQKLSIISKEFNKLNNPEELINKNGNEDNSQISDPNSSDNLDDTRSWNDHIGDYNSFDDHIDDYIKLYFNSLPILNNNKIGANNKYDINLDNEAGVPITMSYQQVSSAIFEYGNFSSVESMISSIESLTNNIPELAGLIKLVQDMKDNEHFANRIFNNFASPIINKGEVVIDNFGNKKYTQSNKSSNPELVNYFNFINSVKITSLSNNNFDISNKIESIKLLRKEYAESLSEIDNDAESLSEINSLKNKLIDDIYNTLKSYYSTISKDSIVRYINNNNKDSESNVLDNITTLLNILDTTNKNAIKTKQVYDDIITERSAIAYKNKLAKQIAVESGNPYNYKKIYPKERTEEYFSNSKYSATLLSKELSKYILTKTDLNSRNALGNLSSDVINNNYFTNFLKTIKNNEALESYKRFKTRGSTYNYSNILYEKRDNKNNIILYGLFRKNNDGTVEITEYAQDLLDMSLFNGASDINKGTNTMYNIMSSGDYLLSSLIAFYSKSDQISNIPKANYFLRTPSDAPKNFTINAPIYNTDGLLKSNNDQSKLYIKEQKEILDKSKIDKSKYELSLSLRPDNNNVDSKKLLELLYNPSKSLNISNYQIEKDGSIILYTESDIDTKYEIRPTFTIVLKGDIIKDENNPKYQYLENYKIEGHFVSDKMPSTMKKELEDYWIKKGIEENKIEQYIDKNHSIYHAVQNMLLGEIHGAANALSILGDFVINEDGLYEFKLKVDTKDPNFNIWKNKLFNVKHYNGDIIKNGKLTGTAFSIKKLYETADINPTEIVFGNNGIFNLSLYGVENAGLTYTKDGNNIQVNISKSQQEQLDKLIEDWIKSIRKDVISKKEQFDNFVKDYTEDQLFNFYINGIIMNANFDDLFGGDSKFYKESIDENGNKSNAQNILKRIKETQASGTAYAGYDITKQDISVISNKNEILDSKGNPLLLPRRKGKSIIYNRSGFNGVTIKNTIRPSDNSESIRKQLIKIGTPKYIANKIADGYTGNTAVNDAQSYITFDEFIRRKIADGTYYKYQKLIELLLDDSVELKDINAVELNQFIQVQKNFYYDQQYDDYTNEYYPRQIKNAEFVLVPKLIQGTELEQLYYDMVENDIDQLNTEETSKAAKKNILEYWDNNGIIKEESRNLFLEQSKNAIEVYSYQYLYKQQDVPQHMIDEQNKAGIQVVKKILDNLPDNDKFNKLKEDFFNNFTANILDSYNEFMSSIDLKINDDGTLSTISGEHYNFDRFYKRALEEAQRLGLDSNILDYLIPETLIDADGNVIREPIMKNFMNNVSSKLESISQSMFNSNITRQKLPGFHAAQITNIGYTRDLKYHPEIIDENGNIIQEAYAEIMVPKWSSKLLGEDINIIDLKEQGIDIFLGYRIPTEGKQSISLLKVVGFLPDANGSTIMVPDDWVTQTGSDFDVDSVYTIVHEIYKDKKGKIRKIQYIDGTDDIFITARYINYVNSNVNKIISKENQLYLTDEEKIEKRKLIKNLVESENKELLEYINTIYDKYFKEETEAYNKLNDNNKLEIKNTFNDKTLNVYEKAKQSNIILENSNSKDSDTNDFININKEFIYNIDEYRNSKRLINQNINDLFDDIKNQVFMKAIYARAKQANLMSLEEFRKQPIELQNTRQARNNKILDTMIEIMRSSEVAEENFARSNFDDIIEANKEINKLKSKKSVPKSTYNVFDQIQFQENAMSGSMLKAFSVTRDTFNSINNVLKSKLSENNTISVVYDLNSIDNNGNKLYDIDTIKSTYDNVKTIDNKAYVIHDKLGNSNNNRNIVGKLLTPYSSQTTAHILDAIKEGAIENENDYTFGVFKTLVDVGIDYKTAISFLRQPAITEIVKAYNENKSAFIQGNYNPIDTAIKRIANKLDIKIGGKLVNDNTSIKDIMYELSNQYDNIFKSKFNTTINDIINNNKFNLDQTKLFDRFNKDIDLLYDLYNIFIFKALQKRTNDISKIARVANPDRFGAKQSIWATNKVLENIQELKDLGVADMLISGNVNIIDALYPFLSKDDKIKNNKSKYPSLEAFLKYSTMASSKVNKNLFLLENDNIVIAINELGNITNSILNESQYNEFKKYLISYVYKSTDKLYFNENLSADININDENKSSKNALKSIENFWIDEEIRLRGYNANLNDIIEILDITNPTKEELIKFDKFSPAQKINYIKSILSDQGVLSYIDVNLYNEYEKRTKGFSSQTLKFNDNANNIENIYNEFRKLAFNDNPILSNIAKDIVKYAFIVEGFNFKKNAVTKMIPNDYIYKPESEGGLDLMNSFVNSLNNISNISLLENNIYENFIRGTKDNKLIKSYRINKENNKYEDIRYKTNEGIYIFDLNNTEDLEFLNKSGIRIEVDEQSNILNYIRLFKGKNNTLYKTMIKDDNLYMYPLNDLDYGEINEFSTNPINNKYKSPKYYKYIINEIHGTNRVINKSTFTSLLKEHPELTSDEIRAIYSYKRPKFEKFKNITSNPFKFEELRNNTEEYAFNQFINSINNKLGDINQDSAKFTFIWNGSKELKNLIGEYNIPTIQSIKNKNGDNILYAITKTNQFKNSIKFLKSDKYLTDKTLKGLNKDLIDIIYKAKDSGIQTLEDVYKVEKINDKTLDNIEFSSGIEDFSFDDTIRNLDTITYEDFENINHINKLILNDMGKRASINSDELAVNALNILKNVDVDINIMQSISDNKKIILSQAAEYYKSLSNIINNKTKEFIQLNDNSWVSILDKAVIDQIKLDKEVLNDYVRLLLEAKNIGARFIPIMDLNIRDESPEIQRYITNIKDAINSVRNNSDIITAMKFIMDEYFIPQISTDEQLLNKFKNITHQFGDADMFDWLFSDIKELDNKSVQIIIKYVEARVNEANSNALNEVDDFKNKLFELKKENTINYDNIIKNGKFITDYTDEFIKDRDDLRNKVIDAKSIYGDNSIEYYKAKLNYDKFKLDNINQEIEDTYYKVKLLAEEKVINLAPDRYIKYQDLKKQRQNIRGSLKGKLDKDELKEFRRLTKEMNALAEFDHTLEGYSDFDPRIEEIYKEANALKYYINTIKSLNNQYFEYEAIPGFNENLEYYLKIINDAETKSGKTLEQLMLDSNYTDAKEWIESNVDYRLTEETEELINNAFATLNNGKRNNKTIFNKITNNKNDAYDKYGIINGNSYNENEINSIKRELEIKYNIIESATGSFESLLRTTPPNADQYTKEFYNNMTDGGKINITDNNIKNSAIKEINSILRIVLDPHTRELHTSSLTINQLNDLKTLYGILDNFREKSTKSDKAKKFIKENVDFVSDIASYNKEKAIASINPEKGYYNLWLSVNSELDKEDNVVPNNKIYGYIKPKESVYNKYLDKAKMDARSIIEKYTEKTPTNYYYAKLDEMKDSVDFDTWYENNHVLNPYTKIYEPLPIWLQQTIKPVVSGNKSYEYKPMWFNTKANVVDEFKNNKYKKYSVNYKYNNKSKYNNNLNINNSEREVRDLFMEIINSKSKTYQSKKFAEAGFLPRRRVDKNMEAKDYIKEGLAFIGIGINDASNTDWNDNSDYAHDREGEVPMMQLLKGKGSKELLKYPKKLIGESDTDYENRIKEYKESNKQIQEDNIEIDKALYDNDWENVMQQFIINSTDFNARQESKLYLYLLMEDLRQNKPYQTHFLSGNLKRNNSETVQEYTAYKQGNNTKTEDVLNTYINRFVNKQFKKDSTKLNNVANFFQNLVSSKFMMMNITGGIANVLTGSNNIFMERFAKEYFDHKTWEEAKFGIYNKNIPAYFANMYSDTSDNLADAIIKKMNVMDADDITEIKRSESPSEYISRLRNAMFAPQTMGEHFMHNTGMFAMMKSHRIYYDHRKKRYVIGSLFNYNSSIENITMLEILNNKPDIKDEYISFLSEIKSDLNEHRKYTEYRKDINEEFLRQIKDVDLIKEYINKRKENIKNAKIEFEKNPNVYEQFELVDGRAKLKADSLINELELQYFKNKVISINNKIHGVYNKLGAANIEKHWIGGLIMQYHKHIYPGLMKRYRRRGMYNEHRSSIEKGSYLSLVQFMSTEFSKANNKTIKLKKQGDEYIIKGLQNYTRAILDTFLNININWQLLPEWERANIKRNLGDMLAITAALFGAIAVHIAGDDDEDIRTSMMYNLALYNMDRLASESMEFTPWGFASEGKKLWSSPIAAWSVVDDLLKSTGLLTKMLIEGDEFNINHTTGLHKGLNKFDVTIGRQVPVYRSYQRMKRLEKNNSFYKLDQNMLGIIPVQQIANWVKE